MATCYGAKAACLQINKRHLVFISIRLKCIYTYLIIFEKENEFKMCISRCRIWHGFSGEEKETSIIWGNPSWPFNRRKDRMDRITSPCAMLLHSLVADLVPVVVIFNVMQAVVFFRCQVHMVPGIRKSQLTSVEKKYQFLLWMFPCFFLLQHHSMYPGSYFFTESPKSVPQWVGLRRIPLHLWNP